MALDDFDTQENAESQIGKPAPRPAAAKPAPAAPAPKAVQTDDEDLFDFPVVEMKLEASAPVAPPKPVAPKPVAIKPVAIKPVAQPAPTPAPAPVVVPVQEKKDIAQAAQIVEDLEELLGAEAEPIAPSRKLKVPSPLALAGVAALVLTNVLGLAFLWRTAQTYQSGVQAMNEKLAETLRRQSEAQSLAAADAQPKTPEVAPTPAGLQSFELSTLQVAREEILAGEYADARRRLARLLAVADRIEAEARQDVEAQAAFLIASSYRKQAELAREKSP